MRIIRRFVSLSILTAFAASGTFACPVCFGQQGSAEVEGAKWAILFLLGVTGTVLGGVLSFMMYLRRRARHLLDNATSNPLQEH